ncbi:T cell receptor beta chain MC.7.G5-like [Scomber scombrus]
MGHKIRRNTLWIYTICDLNGVKNQTHLLLWSHGQALSLSASPSSEQLSGGSATLACLLSGYAPQGAVVSWEVDGTEVTEGVLSSSEEEKSGRYSSSSTLNLNQDRWMKGELYSCRVLHHDHSQIQSLRRSKC